MKMSLARRVVAEFLGTAFLVAAVIGSGIMGEKLANGNVALALLVNTIRRTFQSRRHLDGCLGKRSALDGDSPLCGRPSTRGDGRGGVGEFDVCTASRLVVASRSQRAFPSPQ